MVAYKVHKNSQNAERNGQGKPWCFCTLLFSKTQAKLIIDEACHTEFITGSVQSVKTKIVLHRKKRRLAGRVLTFSSGPSSL